MIAENFILKSWNEQVLNFIHNLQTIRVRPTRNAVHDLRVAVKKIRSYLRLRNMIIKETWKKEFSPVKTIFKISGKQRDYEMSFLLFSKYQRTEKLLMPQFKKFLQINKSFTHQWTKKAMLDFNLEEFQSYYKDVCLSLSSITNTKWTEKIHDYKKELMNKADWQTKDIEENAHEIRKEFKDLYYWLIVCSPNPAQSLLEIKRLDKLLKCLGHWQDDFILLNKLKKFRKEFFLKNTNEAETAIFLEMKIRDNKNELLRKAKKYLKSLIKNKKPENKPELFV